MKRVSLLFKRRQPSTITIDQALTDPHLLGSALGDPATWSVWLSVLKAAFDLPLSRQERATFSEVAGDRAPPARRVNELWCVCGRGSGKTRMAAATAVHIAALEQHTLAKGEVGCVLLVAASRSQAHVAFSYVLGFLQGSPILRQQIENVTASEVKLKGNIVISVVAGSFRTIRGRTLLAVIGDETSFWRDESSAQPDVEIYRACVPSLVRTKGIWIGISTGYRKLGLLYQKWHDHFGQDNDDVLVVQGASSTFNPTLDLADIARAKAADPEAAESEWEGGFRSDIAAFLDDETIEHAIDPARPLELPPRKLKYVAFVDPCGGRHDAFTLSIGHQQGERFIADVVRGRQSPFDPKDVVAEFAPLLKQYGLTSVVGDNYSAEWVAGAFKDEGIGYEVSELVKSQLYLECLPLFMRGAVSIPDHPKLVRELRLLERRTSRIGKDVVDHGRNGSDDYANALCGMLRLLAKPVGYDFSLKWIDGVGIGGTQEERDQAREDANRNWREGRYRNYLLSGGRIK